MGMEMDNIQKCHEERSIKRNGIDRLIGGINRLIDGTTRSIDGLLAELLARGPSQGPVPPWGGMGRWGEGRGVIRVSPLRYSSKSMK